MASPILTHKDFPRWTRAKLGLPTSATLAEEIDRVIYQCWDHVTAILGEDVVDELSADGVDNAERRRRFEAAMHAFVTSELYELNAEHTGSQLGSSTQGKRSRTIAEGAVSSARSAAERYRRTYVEGMFALGYTVRPAALGVHYTPVER